MHRVQARFPQAPPLGDGDVHVWIADLDAGGGAGPVPPDSLDLLSSDERERAGRFRKPREGSRWARSRALLRLLLGRYQGADPASLRFQAGKRGKLWLASGCLDDASGGLDKRTRGLPGERPPLHFNLSHSGALALYALARDQPVGIDVETLDRDVSALTLAERAFDAASVRLLARMGASERKRELLRLWVRHEAALKCSGAGLTGSKATLEHASPAWIAELDLGGDALAAVAAATREPAQLRCGRLEALGRGCVLTTRISGRDGPLGQSHPSAGAADVTIR